MTRTAASDRGEALPPPAAHQKTPTPFVVRMSIYLAIGIVGCTVAGEIGRAYWVFELFSHFRLQYALVLLVLALPPLLARRWKALVLVGGLFMVYAASLVPMWVGAPTPERTGRELRVVLWNVNTVNRRHADVVSFLRQSDADLLLILEIDERWLRELRRGLPEFSHVAAEPRNDNFGIGLFSKTPFEGGTEPMGSASLPIVRVSLDWLGRRISLIGVHTLPPKNARYAAHRNDAFEKLVKMIVAMDAPVILMGDLNVTPWSPYYDDIMALTGLVDGRRGFGIRPTWPAQLGLLGIPIDHCFVSPDVVVRSLALGPGAGSDHRAIVVELVMTRESSAADGKR